MSKPRSAYSYRRRKPSTIHACIFRASAPGSSTALPLTNRLKIYATDIGLIERILLEIDSASTWLSLCAHAAAARRRHGGNRGWTRPDGLGAPPRDTRDRSLPRREPHAQALRGQSARGKHHARRRACRPGDDNGAGSLGAGSPLLSASAPTNTSPRQLVHSSNAHGSCTPAPLGASGFMFIGDF